VVKAWKNHHRITVNYACIYGRVKLVLYDDRTSSPTRGGVMELLLGLDNYLLVVIPPGIWHGFQGLSEPLAIIANCATEPNNPTEYDRLDPIENHLPYKWENGRRA
jgi:dTDP-4-dehydrorhamnose 3,5-epimerase